MHRSRRIGPGVRSHLGGEDRLCRVRHRYGPPGRPTRDLLVADQGAVQPEVPRAAAALRRRRSRHGRRHHQRGRELPRHDHRDTAAAGFRRLDPDARGQVGHLRRGAPARQRGARLGHRGDPHPAPAQHALRAALGDAAQRARGGGVGGGAAQPRVPRRAHRAPADAAAALRARGGRCGALPRAAGGRALRRRRVAGGRGRAAHAARGRAQEAPAQADRAERGGARAAGARDGRGGPRGPGLSRPGHAAGDRLLLGAARVRGPREAPRAAEAAGRAGGRRCRAGAHSRGCSRGLPPCAVQAACPLRH